VESAIADCPGEHRLGNGEKQMGGSFAALNAHRWFDKTMTFNWDDLANKNLETIPYMPTYDEMATPQEINKALVNNKSFMEEMTQGKTKGIVFNGKRDSWEEDF